MAEKTKRLIWQSTPDRRIKKRNGVYWARFSRRGARIEESLDTRSFEIAKRLVDEKESNIHLGIDWRKEHEFFETAWDEFLSDKAKGIKTDKARPTTLAEYIKLGDRHLLPFFKGVRLIDINEEKWEEYVLSIKDKAPGILLFNHRKYLMGFLSWAFRKGKIREKPELYNPDAKDDDGPGKLYSNEELKALRDNASGVLKLAIYMAQYMGMRRSEITQLEKNRIFWDEGVIRLRRQDTKIDEAREVPIHDVVRPLLLAQIEAAKGSAYVFPNRLDPKRPMDRGGLKKAWVALKAKVGVEGRFHDFKHTFITNALRSGMNPIIVAEIVGTSLEVMQKTYLHLTPKDKRDDLQKLSYDLGQIWDKAEIEDFERGFLKRELHKDH